MKSIKQQGSWLGSSIKFALLLLTSFIILCNELFSQNIAQKSLSEYVWDLTYIFPSDKAWGEELKAVQERAKNISTVKSKMGQSAAELAKAMDAIYDLRSRAAKLMIYGMLKHDVNTEDDEAKQMHEAAANLEREVESSLGFLNLEVVKIGANKLKNWIATEPRLARHERRINRIILQAPYSVPGELQSVIETMKGWPAVSGDGFFALYESDLDWPTYKNSEGNSVTVSYSTYRNLRRSANANDRLNTAKTYLSYISKYENIMGHLYTSRIKADLAIARCYVVAQGWSALWVI
jgi:oligoendopeptidase F